MLEKFAGDYVVKIFGHEIRRHTSSPEALILLEYCSGGHLLNMLNLRKVNSSGRFLGQDEICRIFGMLLQAILPMHTANPPVVHRDLKLENILFAAV